MKRNISNNYSKIGITSFFPLRLCILVLSFSISGFVLGQTSYTADDYWFNKGGGITNRLNASTGDGIITWFGEGYSWQLAVQVEKRFTHPDWIFRRPNIGTSFPVLHSPFTTARIIGAGDLQFAGGGRGLPNGAVAPDMVIKTDGKIGFGTTEPHDQYHFKGSTRVTGNLYLGNVDPPNAGLRFDIKPVGSNYYWLGTTTSYNVRLAAGNKDIIDLNKDGYAVIFRNGQYPTNLNISAANKAKYSLFVIGGILSEDYTIGPRDTWADYVFNTNYKLKGLEQVENFIMENKRLPDMPSASDIQADGYSLHEMNVKLLQKIEELTLYVIEQDKQNKNLQKEIENLKVEQSKYRELLEQ